MTDFSGQQLRGSTFSDVDLSKALFHTVDLADATFKAVNFRGVRMRGVELVDVQITGEVWNVSINGVDVGPLIEAELNLRDPQRAKMRPDDPEGLGEAWTIIEHRWDETVARARRLDPMKLHESVNGEWSFVETLRHLIFATDSWVTRGLLGDPRPWHPLALPWDEMPDVEGVPRDRTSRPSLEEVLMVRRERMATVRRVIEDLTPDRLAAQTEPVQAPGWPPPGESFAVKECLHIVLNEEWEHRNYAERDLAVLSA